MKKLLCYIGLVILNILLLLPPALRIFVKDSENQQEETKKSEIAILKCNKTKESISSTFLNGTPQNIAYYVEGDYSNTKEESNQADEIEESEETEEIKENTTTTNKNLLEIIKPLSQIEYTKEINQTKFSVQASELLANEEYSLLFNSIENQQKYFIAQGFSCEKNVSNLN